MAKNPIKVTVFWNISGQIKVLKRKYGLVTDLYKLVIYAYDQSRGVNKIVDLSCKFSLLSNFPAEIVNTVEKNI